MADQTVNYDSTGGPGVRRRIVYQATDGTDTDQGTITITVAAGRHCRWRRMARSRSRRRARRPVPRRSAQVNVATLPGYSAGNAPSDVSITTPPDAANGTATATGTTIRFTPAATFFAGTATIGYTITDSDGDTDTGVITVTVADVTPVLADGTITTDQDTRKFGPGPRHHPGQRLRGPAHASRSPPPPPAAPARSRARR